MNAREQVWRCEECGRQQVCPIPAVEVLCTGFKSKHKQKKMALIKGQAIKEKSNG